MRRLLLVLSLLTGLIAVQLASVPASSAPASSPPGAELTVQEPRVNGLVDLLGIDDATPELSWKLHSTERDQLQSGYQILVASSLDRLSPRRADLWDSGKVSSARSTHVPYDGRPLESRQRAYWKVRVWDGDGQRSEWSAPAHWELGLSDDDWSAHWIGNPDWLNDRVHPAVQDLSTPQEGRYVRIAVTDIADTLAKTEDAQPGDWKVELAEIGIVDSSAPDTNLALGAEVTVSDSDDIPGEWEPQYLNDGRLTTDSVPYGYRSEGRAQGTSWDSDDIPVVITFDLGEVRTFDRILMYPRTDVVSPFGDTPNFPKNFNVYTSVDGSTFTPPYKVKKWPPPSTRHTQPDALPVFAKQFSVGPGVRNARLYITGVGMYDATINGRPVSDAVLEPPNTDYNRELVYNTYDVTRLLRSGRPNAIGVELGNGIYSAYDTPDTADHYQKLAGTYGQLELLAQLEITYADGRTQTVATDSSWRTTLGGTTFTNWFGGEDYDAGRLSSGWDTPGANRSGWQQAEPTTQPTPGMELVARSFPPIEPVGELDPVEITNPAPGVHVFDFGINFAGWPELKVKGPAGTKIELRPAEQLDEDGRADQSNFTAGGTTSGAVWDTLTLGRGTTVWHPQFIYHGFRYLEVEGLPSPPTDDTATGIILRTANDAVGSFSSSNELLNSIHTIIDRAVQGNMYSTLTDCPTREKLGWLEQDSLVYGTVSRGYDIEAYYRKIMRDMALSQTSQGQIPNVAPDYARYGGGDANWGSTFILGAWQQYKTYGDLTTLRRYYPAMRDYLEFLNGKSSGYLLDRGDFGDWIQNADPATPKGVLQTYAYHRVASTMSEIATVVGNDADATEYADLTEHIGEAFNAKYFDAANATYANGTHASDAMAIDMGVVPADHEQAVLDHLVAGIRAEGNHTTVGEIGLHALINALSETGRDDVLYDLVTQTTSPSYGYQVVNGATSLGEHWNGPTANASQNHFMLGAIDEWFTERLAGIDQAQGSVAFNDLVIKPQVLGTLDQVAASYDSSYGTIRSEWTRDGASLRLDVEVPVNTVATVHVPLAATGATEVDAPNGADYVGNADGYAVYQVGSGSWSFTTSG